jgi:hypothetical protein
VARYARTLLATGSILALSLVGVQAAVADPAAPFSDSGCVQLTLSNGDQYRVCWSDKGVAKTQTTPSGNTTGLYNVKSNYTQWINGTVVFSTADNVESASLDKNGVPATSHYRQEFSEFDIGYQSCSYDSSWTIANGEIRHNVVNVVCTPV